LFVNQKQKRFKKHAFRPEYHWLETLALGDKIVRHTNIAQSLRGIDLKLVTIQIVVRQLAQQHQRKVTR